MVLRPRFSNIGHGALLIVMIFIFVLYPILSQTASAYLIFKLLYSLVIYMSLYLAARHWLTLCFAVLLALPAEIIVWLPYFDNIINAQLTRLMLNFCFYSLVFVILMRHILAAQNINKDIIFAAVIGYFIVGILFTTAYGCIEMLSPQSFKGIPTINQGLDLQEQFEFKLQYLFYYSYITLTTLGYGGVAPKNRSTP